MRVPSLDQVRRMRCEMTLAGEALAAFQLASCKRMRCLGFDESTKLQIGVLSTSVQAEMPDGTTLDVVLQGALMIPGGTAEQVAHALETRVFGRGRAALQGWTDMHEKMHGVGSWSGPLAKALGLHRLGAGGLVMSDTCNGAPHSMHRTLTLILCSDALTRMHCRRARGEAARDQTHRRRRRR